MQKNTFGVFFLFFTFLTINLPSIKETKIDNPSTVESESENSFEIKHKVIVVDMAKANWFGEWMISIPCYQVVKCFEGDENSVLFPDFIAELLH